MPRRPFAKQSAERVKMTALHRLLVAALWCTLPLAALADEPFVDWTATSGPLPPAHAWSTHITISAAGKLALTHCTGFASTGPACSTHKATVARPKLDAIRSAVDTAGLSKRPLRLMDPLPVGGSTVSARISTGGKTHTVSGFTAEADADRAGLVLRAIYKAVPTALAQRFIEGD